MMNIETYRQVIGEKLKEMREKRNQSVESAAIKGHMDDDDVIAVESGYDVSLGTFIRYIVGNDLYIYFAEKSPNRQRPHDFEDLERKMEECDPKL